MLKRVMKRQSFKITKKLLFWNPSKFLAKKKSKRKRKLIVDVEKILSSNIISSQLASTEDIVKPATLAPPTKMRMKLKDSSTTDKLFNNPNINNIAPVLRKALVHNLTSKIVDAPEPQDVGERVELEEIDSPREEVHQEEVRLNCYYVK